MSVLTRLFVEAERRASSAVAPLLHRRHRRTLTQGAVDDRTVRLARDSWWGNDSRWYPGGTPPRAHNRVTPLIDGEAFLGAIHEALTQAEAYVYIAGWCLTPYVPLRRRTPEDLVRTRLIDVLADVAQRVPVRVLLWGGALALIHPTTRTMKGVEATINRRGGDLLCRLDTTASRTHCHHQKAIVVDGRLAFVGGMDLTTFAGDRWDGSEHAMRAGVNWHDVALRLEGEAVADVEHNFRQRWEAVTGDRTLPGNATGADQPWQTPVQVVRTIPHHRYPFAPKGEFGIHHVYVQAIRAAREFIYLETQYLWSPDIMDALSEVIKDRNPASFRVVIVLPARATSGKWDNDQHVKRLRSIDAGRGVFEAYSLYSSGPTAGESAFGYQPIYVHAKVAIIDDEWVTVGSANLNNRGMVTDSELNLVVRDPGVARALRVDLWSEHLGIPRDEVEKASPVALIDSIWKEKAAVNARVSRKGERPLESSVHRYEFGLSPGALILDELEAATFEH
jgi:phosphatidylserine/phosphatidylglycerophosphate/cardiolipin synthase-like enzyme